MYLEPTDLLWGFVGGLLIGLASAIFLLMNGRIAGISGIAAGLFKREPSRTWMENAAFVIGLAGAPMLYALIQGPPEIGITDALWMVVVGGLLVGIGTRLGSGCTSGHGVCGLSRFSLRSLVATGAFMVVAAIVASLILPALPV